ncbi:hypothetical protein ACFY2W_26820 [Streptomyces sp. NPDC001262]
MGAAQFRDPVLAWARNLMPLVQSRRQAVAYARSLRQQVPAA